MPIVPDVSPTTPPAPAPAARRVWGRPLWLLAFVALTVCLFAPVRRALVPSLDDSNYATFAYFTSHHFQFGKEALHLGGPYGFIHYGFVYGGNLFYQRMSLELLTKMALAALVLWFFARSRPGALRRLWVVRFVVMA